MTHPTPSAPSPGAATTRSRDGAATVTDSLARGPGSDGGGAGVAFDPVPYARGTAACAWLARSSHYINNPPPGCLFAVGAKRLVPGLFGDVGGGPLVGLCVVGRPVARQLPQDGTMGEITRFVLVPGLPHGTASALLRRAAEIAPTRGVRVLIAYHDRTRHTGCIYKKAGFRRDGVVAKRTPGWNSRPNRKSADYEQTSKRRWRLECA